MITVLGAFVILRLTMSKFQMLGAKMEFLSLKVAILGTLLPFDVMFEGLCRWD